MCSVSSILYFFVDCFIGGLYGLNRIGSDSIGLGWLFAFCSDGLCFFVLAYTFVLACPPEWLLTLLVLIVCVLCVCVCVCCLCFCIVWLVGCFCVFGFCLFLCLFVWFFVCLCVCLCVCVSVFVCVAFVCV